jgi:Arc/MetJ-type ribon-helix-helix transcriptional regulator
MSGQTVATSVRLPEELQRAAREAVENGLARSLTELIVDGLRDRLVALATENEQYADKVAARAALEELYADDPQARPTLAQIAMAGAEMDDHPAFHHPELIDLAIADLGEDAHPEDVLAWVKGVLAVRPSAPDESAVA